LPSTSSLDAWPALPFDAWKDTYATLHMWMQIVGKVALARAVPMNHSWAIAFLFTPRGLSTRPLSDGTRSFSFTFDFAAHQLIIDTSASDLHALPLSPRTVAEFYQQLMSTLDVMGLHTPIWPMPVEIASPVRFDLDTAHQSYEREYVERWWRIVSQSQQVLSECRQGFIGKCSPAHFFWGSFDLACSRFSGRLAPPREGPQFMREAYSHELISHGFWPGSAPLLEPAFYAYAVPEPPGLAAAAIQPDAAYYHQELKEFILPYEAVRTAASPEGAIAAFVESSYDRAATLAQWDRATLERPV
jgi:hypothetical protein